MSNTVKLPTCPKCGAPIPLAAPQGLCPKCVLLRAATATEPGVPATATSEIPSIERLAAAFPQLQILELIGRGGMGFVFKARQPHLDRFVALKLLPDKLAKDAQFTERFNREGRVLAKLNHPNIVSVFDFGQTGGFYYLLMEYIDGVNLRQAMRAGRFSPPEALSIVPKICEALQYAHEQGILHRDIKPENILLDAKGRVKIADFGIAKLVGEDQSNVTLTNTGAALGTPHYMAPEQLEKPSTVDHRADIYSLGVVFYEMLTGELPIGRFAPPSSKTPTSARVDEIVLRALEKERELRQKDAGEFKTQVEQAAAEPPREPIQPRMAVDPPPRWVKPAGAVFLALGATALVPTFMSLGTQRVEWHLFTLVMLTGIALLTRNPVVRWMALVANVVGLFVPWLFVFSSPDFRGLVSSAGLAIWFTLLQTSTFAAGLWVLLRTDVKALFESASPAKPISRERPVPEASSVRRPGQALVAVGILNWIGSIIVMSVLTYLGLGRAFPLSPQELGVVGLLMILFSSVILLAGLKMIKLQSYSLAVLGSVFAMITTPGNIIGLPVGLWALVTLRQPRVRAAFAQAGAQPSGAVQWVSAAAVFAVVAGLIVVPNLTHRRQNVVPPSESDLAGSLGDTNRAVEAAPMIQFIFTAVELREEEGARWLAMDFVEQTRGDCQRTIRYHVTVPDFIMQTRTTSFMTDAKAGFAPVLHQRIMWKLPNSLPQAEAQALRELVGKERIGKPIVLEPGEEYPLFKTVVPGGGALVASIGVRLKSESALSKSREKTASSPKNMASSELWAPKLAPDERPNPSEILQEATNLAQQGRYEEALQRHIWYHRHALETDPAQAGVRLSFALSYWAELARRYPKAKDALVEVRDQGAREFEQGGGYFDLFKEVAAINRELNEQDATISLLKSIDAQDPRLAHQCYPAAEDLLVERGDYSLGASFIPNFQKRFEQIRVNRERILSRLGRTPGGLDRGRLAEEADRSFVKGTRALIEILVGVGRKADAENIREQALAVLTVPELRSAIDDAGARVEKLKTRREPQ